MFLPLTERTRKKNWRRSKKCNFLRSEKIPSHQPPNHEDSRLCDVVMYGNLTKHRMRVLCQTYQRRRTKLWSSTTFRRRTMRRTDRFG